MTSSCVLSNASAGRSTSGGQTLCPHAVTNFPAENPRWSHRRLASARQRPGSPRLGDARDPSPRRARVHPYRIPKSGHGHLPRRSPPVPPAAFNLAVMVGAKGGRGKWAAPEELVNIWRTPVPLREPDGVGRTGTRPAGRGRPGAGPCPGGGGVFPGGHPPRDRMGQRCSRLRQFRDFFSSGRRRRTPPLASSRRAPPRR